jgi:parallel beta-helix repeat protein
MEIMKAIILSVLISGITFAATYYVDSDKGKDSNSGKGQNTPWKTISKVNSVSFSPGDIILFKSGCLWREQLNIKTSGSKSSPVTFASYGKGNRPVISGADIITGFTQHSGSVWKKSIKSPGQVFFDETRGTKKQSVSELKNEKDWYFDNSFLYILSFNPSNSYKTIEASFRANAITVNADNIIIKDIQVERTSQDAVLITGKSDNVISDNLEFIQWTDEVNSMRAGISILGSNCRIQNSTFGQKTKDDIAGQNLAGFMAILISGKDNECNNNKIYHNSVENESANGKYAYGIRIFKAGGITKVNNNYIYHTASNGILADTYSNKGDEIRIFNNEISYTGQAGISVYKTRASDGTGGTGFIYNNTISYANRLGGEKGGGGNRAAGIHFNDGIQKDTEISKPFIKWFCYENTVHDTRSANERNSPDSDGIAIDYNANNTEVYKNTVYNCDGKGIYIWNADNCKVYFNIISGNDCGISVSASNKGNETADNNIIFNNVFYKNYNGEGRGKNYNTEIYFGQNGNNNRFMNNILYASSKGSAYFYNSVNTNGCIPDYNLIYSEDNKDAIIARDKNNKIKTLGEWKKMFPAWDKNSIYADPQFKNPDKFDFSLKAGSPAIKKGTPVDTLKQVFKSSPAARPDIGAYTFGK